MEENHEVKVMVIAKDLSQSNAPQEIYDEVKKAGIVNKKSLPFRVWPVWRLSRRWAELHSPCHSPSRPCRCHRRRPPLRQS